MAYVRNPVVYVPDLTNGRPIVDGKVYLLTSGTIPPMHDSTIDPADLLAVTYINEAGNTVEQPQPLYTSKGGCLYGNFPDAARQFMIAPQAYVFAAYNRIGELQYSAETSASDYVETDTLAAAGSTVLVGGVDASYLNVLANKNGVDDYTLINPDVSKITSAAMTVNQSLSVVITGDSLSFNGYDYTEFAVVGSGYATDQPFGMSSWSHLLRDTFFTSNPAFSSVSQLSITTNAAKIYPTTAELFKHIGMNAKAIFYNFTDTSKTMKIVSNYTTTAYLVVSSAPAASAVKFYVDGVLYNNETTDGLNLGYGYKLIPTLTATPTITGVELKNSVGSGGFWLYGITSQNAVTPKITGKGGYTSGQILAEYSTLVEPYAPDIIYYFIGANDIDSSVSLSTFGANLQSFIDNARADKPDCVIVMLSSVPSSAPSLNRAKTKTYIKVMYDIAVSNGCSLIDMYSKLEQIDPSYWRFDAVHFNNVGNNLVFAIVKALTFETIPVTDSFYPERALYLGASSNWMNSRFIEASARVESVVVKFEAGAPTVLGSLSSSSEFADDLVLSYVVDGSFDRARIVCPATHVIGTSSELIIGSALTERVTANFVNNQLSWEFARSNSGGRQLIAGSDLYLAVTFIPAA